MLTLRIGRGSNPLGDDFFFFLFLLVNCTRIALNQLLFQHGEERAIQAELKGHEMHRCSIWEATFLLFMPSI